MILLECQSHSAENDTLEDTMEYKKVNQNINNIVNDQVRKLESIFPSAVKDGEVDFEALREELGQFDEVDNEKYELTWAGKKNAKKIAQEDVVGRTLKFIPEDSKEADTTENLYIEGDNLEVLKLLRQNYYGGVKLIFIDPPYNTGNDFLYNDSFVMPVEESEKLEMNINSFGQRFTVNSKSQNRFHAKWLDNIYPRLKVAKDLMAENGTIFICIDDNELANLKEVCDEIFGNINFIADIAWKHTQQSKNDERYFSRQYNHILVYAKNKDMVDKFYFERSIEDNKSYSNPDNDPKGDWRSGDVRSPNYRKTLCYNLVAPNGDIIVPPDNGWRWSEESIKEKIETGEIKFKADNSGIIRKIYLSDQEGRTPENLWQGEKFGTTRQATAVIKELFDGISVFDTPKPWELIASIISISTRKGDTVLDFYSGSASSAQAVIEQNTKDNLNRKFIMVQLPEICGDKSEAFRQGYTNICEIGKERIRRAGEKIKQEHPDADIDIGFKVFRTADTNIKWNSIMDMGQVNVNQLEYTPDLVDFMPGANDIDIVYELMLRQRDVALSETLEHLSDIGNRTYLYASSYLVCLETTITEDLVSKLAKLDPLPIKFIFRDSAFKDDISLKDETFRRLKALIEKNAGTSKPTYTVEFI